jgi:hypothetical protein
MSAWVILNDAGAVIEQIISAGHPLDPPGPGLSPGYVVDREFVHPVDRLGDLEVESFLPGTGWVPKIAGARARALRHLAQLRAERVEARLSPRLAHARKREELKLFDAGALADIPFLAAEAEATGVRVETVAAKVRAQIEAEESSVAQSEALMVAAKAKVRTAATVEEIDSAMQEVAE